jgi:hypothetical protein
MSRWIKAKEKRPKKKKLHFKRYVNSRLSVIILVGLLAQLLQFWVCFLHKDKIDMSEYDL